MPFKELMLFSQHFQEGNQPWGSRFPLPGRNTERGETTNRWRRKEEERKSWQPVGGEIHPAVSTVPLPDGIPHGISCDGNGWAMVFCQMWLKLRRAFL